jgi:hypothetical protein
MTNSIIHPDQRRASYKEVSLAFMKGFRQFCKRLEENEEKPKIPNFSCYELLGKEVKAADVYLYEEKKLELKKL